jgi:hypothetical protein
MQGHLTDEEWDRIAAFANAKAYERTPEMLLPDAEVDAD